MASATSIEETEEENANLLLDSRKKNIIWMLTVLYDERNKTGQDGIQSFFTAKRSSKVCGTFHRLMHHQPLELLWSRQ